MIRKSKLNISPKRFRDGASLKGFSIETEPRRRLPK